MATVFEGDSYKTPEKVKRAIREYVLLRSRWSPYSFFIKVIFKYRALALKGLYTDDVWADSSRELMGYLESCGAKFDIRGMDNVKKISGPMVFVANHMGTMETTILPGLICPIKPVTYVVKEKLVQASVSVVGAKGLEEGASGSCPPADFGLNLPGNETVIVKIRRYGIFTHTTVIKHIKYPIRGRVYGYGQNNGSKDRTYQSAAERPQKGTAIHKNNS